MDTFGATGLRALALPSRAEVASIAFRIIHQLTDGGRLLLLTDYDGTLTPIVPTPDEAWLPSSGSRGSGGARTIPGGLTWALCLAVTLPISESGWACQRRSTVAAMGSRSKAQA